MPDFSYVSLVHQQTVFSVISFRKLLFLKLFFKKKMKGTFTKRFRRDNVFMPGFNGFLMFDFDWWQKQFCSEVINLKCSERNTCWQDKKNIHLISSLRHEKLLKGKGWLSFEKSDYNINTQVLTEIFVRYIFS